ncbi:putative ABC-type phosphate/phosphonate transport system/ periplasmic component [Synechococcus sp. BIOS-E4-1]|uniref:PhnD/SsuA/transferrin family substrate-binding protein n=1 Tax=Synechococcus sp. BIOS-E4-1 TaxID=1400864 RepID=UPI00164557A9|nr:PhnD/SsuA/transferrin family substrate-binding protein [Synechococcus sp. BIOS-E4-1]QNI56800.1 putative ABC-type phosphate/phosphonate transport system/ periplasmic component [Synechococcus sp. BIOS-E4-1]
MGLRQKHIVGPIIAGLLLFGCGQDGSRVAIEQPKSKAKRVDLRITEEPNYSQDKMYEKMKIFTEYLHRQTGLNIEYIPAINYSHAYELFASGKVDLFWSGSLNTAKILNADPDAKPIAIEEKSFANILLVNRQILDQVKSGLDSKQPLQALKGRSVVFGNSSSGSSFLTPLLEMKSQGVTLLDLRSCTHEQKHELRAMFLGDSNDQDFAFVPGTVDNPLQHVPPAAQSEVIVGWASDKKRNNYILASSRLLKPSVSPMVIQIQEALLAWNKESRSNRELLKDIWVTGFELPNSKEDLKSFQEMKEFVKTLGARTRCTSNQKT